MWILLTLLAAFMQAWRNAFQSQLSKEVSVAGVTLARFIWAGPIAAVYLVGLYLWQNVGVPDFSGRFIGFILGASAMQILATGLMVKLFKLQNFAIGAGLAKSEAVVAAILGTVFFWHSFITIRLVGCVAGWCGDFSDECQARPAKSVAQYSIDWFSLWYFVCADIALGARGELVFEYRLPP